MVTLSVIIPSYGTKEVTQECLQTLCKHLSKYNFLSEVIVIDDNSPDDSANMLTNFSIESNISNVNYRFIINSKNIGYGASNNKCVKTAQGKYLLLLNSDAFLQNNVDLQKLIQQMVKHPTIGVITAKLVLPNGDVDMACHRGFPTLWNSFTYFSKLEKLASRLPIKFFKKVFGGYHLLHKPFNTQHEIDSPEGAFMLLSKDLYTILGGFDERFFMYGEDLDLAYRIKQLGYIIWYDPTMTVLHKKRSSGLNSKKSTLKSKTTIHFYESMKLFFDKHYAQYHSKLFNRVIYLIIDAKMRYAP